MLNISEKLPVILANRGGYYKTGSCYIELANDSRMVIDSKAVFHFNCSWLKADPLHSILAIRENASLTVRSNFKIYTGSEIYVNKDASLVLGSGYINNHTTIHCFERIEIGEEVAIADHVTIRDSDSHLFNGKPVHLMAQPIVIGDHVWVGTGAIILKGVTIGTGAVIAAGAVVTKNIPAACLAAGAPAKVIQKDIRWE